MYISSAFNVRVGSYSIKQFRRFRQIAEQFSSLHYFISYGCKAVLNLHFIFPELIDQQINLDPSRASIGEELGEVVTDRLAWTNQAKVGHKMQAREVNKRYGTTELFFEINAIISSISVESSFIAFGYR